MWCIILFTTKWKLCHPIQITLTHNNKSGSWRQRKNISRRKHIRGAGNWKCGVYCCVHITWDDASIPEPYCKVCICEGCVWLTHIYTFCGCEINFAKSCCINQAKDHHRSCFYHHRRPSHLKWETFTLFFVHTYVYTMYCRHIFCCCEYKCAVLLGGKRFYHLWNNNTLCVVVLDLMLLPPLIGKSPLEFHTLIVHFKSMT